MSFNFMARVSVHSDFGPKKIKSATASTFPASTCHEVMGLDDMILVLMLSFKPAFSQLLINIHMLFFWIFCFVKFVLMIYHAQKRLSFKWTLFL